MSDELKPCPFCGGTSIRIDPAFIAEPTAFCDDCGCEGPGAANTGAAIAAWNQRTDTRPPKVEGDNELAGLDMKRLRVELAAHPLNGSFSNGSLADYFEGIRQALEKSGLHTPVSGDNEHSTPDRNAVLEEAVKVADAFAMHKRHNPDDALVHEQTATDIAAAIRALTTTPEPKP